MAKIAEHTVEGVKNTAPKAAAKLAEAKNPIDKILAELSNPKQTPKTAETVAAQTKTAAKALEAAAAQLRSEIKETAKNLVRVADDQIARGGRGCQRRRQRPRRLAVGRKG